MLMTCIIQEPGGRVLTDEPLCRAYFHLPDSCFDLSTVYLEQDDTIHKIDKPEHYRPMCDPNPMIHYAGTAFPRYEPNTYRELGFLPTWATLACAPKALLEHWWSVATNSAKGMLVETFIFETDNLDTLNWWWDKVCEYGDPQRVRGFNLNLISARGHNEVLEWMWEVHDDDDVPLRILSDDELDSDEPGIYYNYRAIEYARRGNHESVLRWWRDNEPNIYEHPALA